MRFKLILLLLQVLLFSTHSFCQSEKIDPSMEHTYWNFIRAKILPPNDYAARFETDIKVQLKGNVTHKDSLYIKSIITELKGLIKLVDIQLTDSIGNFILGIDDPRKPGIKEHSEVYFGKNGAIAFREYAFNSRAYNPHFNRNKIIRYYLYRGLSEKKHNPRENTGLPGSVFQVEDPMKSEIIDIDKFIIQKLYSHDFYKQFKDCFNNSIIDYYNYRFGNNIKYILNTLGLILGFILLLLLLKFRLINTETTSWWSYMKQGFLTIHCILFFYLLSEGFSSYSYLSWSQFLKLLLATELLFLTLLSGLYYSEKRIAITKISNKLVVQTISTAFFIYLFFIIYKQIYILSLTNTFIDHWSLGLQLEKITILISAVCLRLIFNFVNLKNIQEIRLRDIELSQLKTLKSKAELQALHSRINPHFLHNSLNSIAALAYINPSKTEQMALALSDFFRYAINHKDQDRIEVAKEVEIARTYLQIEKVRFGDDLDYSINVDKLAEKILIPRFLIQPLIENAVKHGVSVIQEKGVIKLEISKQKDHLLVRVFDNGLDFPDVPISGYGLQSLYEKLEIIYGESAKISWENQPNKNICIRLPFTTKAV